MALKVELKPGERIIIGDCVITNHDQRTRLLIEGQAPILREKDILTPRARRHAGQAHLSRGPADVHVAAIRAPHHEVYFSLVRDILAGGAQHLAAHREHQQSNLNGRDV